MSVVCVVLCVSGMCVSVVCRVFVVCVCVCVVGYVCGGGVFCCVCCVYV